MNDNEYNFFALTPIDKVDLGVYENALDYVFKHENVLNIAVSGSYGAGKSSVLASYKKQHPDKKFLHISLAHFCAADGESSSEDSGDKPSSTIETVIEGKILNQLIHQINPDKIPRTNFRVTKEIPKRRNFFVSLIVALGMILSLYSFFFSEWTSFVQSFTSCWLRNITWFSTYPETRLAAGIGIFAILIYLIYMLIKLQINRNIINKAQISGIEIEIFKDSNESFFDKYLNEVLYLFGKVDSDVIVFEDIDRYDSSGIFERLHEINTLVNNNRKKTPLRFFYLMRDDIFQSKDRTKFFDFIIPIVPVVDGSNSFNKFIECFTKSGLIAEGKVGIDLEFLQGLSLYIDDMRILQNICNEFFVYHSKLSTTEQNPNKMLALIAYKNLFPRDFAYLQLGQGFLYEIIGGNGKERLIASEKERLQNIIVDKTAELNAVKNEMATPDELAIIFNAKMVDVLHNGYNRPSSTSNPEICRQQLEEHRRNSSIKDIITEYDNRVKFCTENETTKNMRVHTLEVDISTAKHQITTLLGLRLVNLITRENIDGLFKAEYTSETGKIESFNPLKESPYFAMLKYFVREGFIDETYSDYMTYFYENSLTRTDKVFLRSVTDKKAKDTTYKLDNPKMIVSRLPTAYFEQMETLNFSLFSFLIADFNEEQTFTDKTQRLLQQLKINKQFAFILDFYHHESNLLNLIKTFGVEWSSFISDLFLYEKIGIAPAVPPTATDVFVKQYAYVLFALIGEENKRIAYLDDNSKACLGEYISNDANFLATDECNDPFVAEGIKLLQVSFISINSATARPQLLEAIYHRNSYDINFENIETMLRMYYSNADFEALHTANYTIIMTQDKSPLAMYINDNINTYLGVVITACKSEISDSPQCVISLLNNTNIDTDKKITYISYLTTNLSNLNKIDVKSLWPELLKNIKVVDCSASNIISYFVEHCIKKFDDTLVQYINAKGENVTFNINADFNNDEIAKDFFGAVVVAVTLDNSVYKKYIKQFDYYYADFSIDGLPQDKLAILDELSKITMTTESLKFMREHYEPYLFSFIKNHIEEYIDVVSDAKNFSQAEMFELLCFDISDSDKIAILKYDQTPISIQDKRYSDEVCAHILKYNYSSIDFGYLLKKYSSYEIKTQSAILNIAENAIDSVLPLLRDMDSQLLSAIFKSDKITLVYKRSIFESLAPTANNEWIQKWLPCVESSDFLVLYEERKRPKFENTEWNKSLLEIFKKRSLIDDYELDQDSTKYSIRRHRGQSNSVKTELL